MEESMYFNNSLKPVSWHSANEVIPDIQAEAEEERLSDKKLTAKQERMYLLDLDPIIFYDSENKPIGMLRLGFSEWRGNVFGEFTETSTVILTREGFRSVVDWSRNDPR